jgi:hypothetical protein
MTNALGQLSNAKQVHGLEADVWHVGQICLRLRHISGWHKNLCAGGTEGADMPNSRQ